MTNEMENNKNHTNIPIYPIDALKCCPEGIFPNVKPL